MSHFPDYDPLLNFISVTPPYYLTTHYSMVSWLRNLPSSAPLYDFHLCLLWNILGNQHKGPFSPGWEMQKWLYFIGNVVKICLMGQGNPQRARTRILHAGTKGLTPGTTCFPKHHRCGSSKKDLFDNIQNMSCQIISWSLNAMHIPEVLLYTNFLSKIPWYWKEELQVRCLHVTDTSLISGTAYSSPSIGMILEQRTKSKPWAMDMAPNK